MCNTVGLSDVPRNKHSEAQISQGVLCKAAILDFEVVMFLFYVKLEYVQFFDYIIKLYHSTMLVVLFIFRLYILLLAIFNYFVLLCFYTSLWSFIVHSSVLILLCFIYASKISL